MIFLQGFGTRKLWVAGPKQWRVGRLDLTRVCERDKEGSISVRRDRALFCSSLLTILPGYDRIYQTRAIDGVEITGIKSATIQEEFDLRGLKELKFIR